MNITKSQTTCHDIQNHMNTISTELEELKTLNNTGQLLDHKLKVLKTIGNIALHIIAIKTIANNNISPQGNELLDNLQTETKDVKTKIENKSSTKVGLTEILNNLTDTLNQLNNLKQQCQGIVSYY